MVSVCGWYQIGSGQGRGAAGSCEHSSGPWGSVNTSLHSVFVKVSQKEFCCVEQVKELVMQGQASIYSENIIFLLYISLFKRDLEPLEQT
jgi:hypothetical protein